MKILKIRFQNIHSLKGEHEIDFANGILGEAGLFAITGATGSGKSTLLDVITLALYNRIARIDGKVSRNILEHDGSIMTRNMSSCYAEVEYAANGKSYRSHWSIERNRNNNLNIRKQELVDATTGTILESGTRTPDKNEEIIRLSYEQFVKAMVLSQGEFSKLLQAPRNERNKLLEDITGAKSYRNIGKAVFQRYAEIRDRVKIKNATLEGISLLSTDDIKANKRDLKELEISRPKVQKTYEQQRGQIEVRKQLLEAQKTQKHLLEKAVELEGFFKDFETDKALLTKHEQLAKYSDTLRNYELIGKDYRNIKLELERIKKEKEGDEQMLSATLKTISSLIGATVTQEDASTKLEKFRSTISKLQVEENTKKDAAQLYQNQLKGSTVKLQQLGYKLASPTSPNQFKKVVDDLNLGLQATIASSGLDSAKELDEQLEVLRSLQEHARVVLDKKSTVVKLEKQLADTTGQLKLEQGKEKENTETLVRLNQEFGKLNEEVIALRKSLEHQRKHQSLDAHRLQLTDKEPCPLCGALDHPYAITKPHFNANEELLKNKETLLTTNGELIISLKENNKFRVGEIQRIQAEINEKKKEQFTLNAEISPLLPLLKWNLEDSLEIWQAQQKELNVQVQQQGSSRLAFTANDILKELQEPHLSWEKSVSDYERLKAERGKLYSGVSIDSESNRLSTKIAESLASQKSLENQILTLNERLKQTEESGIKHREELNLILTKEGIEDLKQLRLAILPEEVAAKHRKTESDLVIRKIELSEKQTANTDALNALLEKDNTGNSLEELTALFTDSKEKWETLTIHLGKISQLVEDDQKTRERFKNEQKVLDALKKDQLLWKTMNDLIGDSYGNKFSNFVQDLTLEQLIGYANKRLADFTDRYLLDIPTADEAEKSDTLKIFDTYMGNARRSVKTLSGGETFLVSLAMAFALSDIASRNVKIESLFIDEGFGTLDPETLDQAITILERMQNEGDRSVGVISHVGALKERITTQIQLEKSSLGHSQIRVVQ